MAVDRNPGLLIGRIIIPRSVMEETEVTHNTFTALDGAVVHEFYCKEKKTGSKGKAHG